jgi:hypothetical protein
MHKEATFEKLDGQLDWLARTARTRMKETTRKT